MLDLWQRGAFQEVVLQVVGEEQREVSVSE